MLISAATSTNPLTIDRSQAIAGLTRIRQEWQEAIEGDGKPFASDTMAYLLYDVSEALGLTAEEQTAVIGTLILL